MQKEEEQQQFMDDTENTSDILNKKFLKLTPIEIRLGSLDNSETRGYM